MLLGPLKFLPHTAAGPWFEGQLAQALADILKGNRSAAFMIQLAAVYALVIFIVQLCRYWKRLYVRRFANDMNRDMKAVLYRSLLQQETSDHPDEGTGQLLTKAVADVDACVEGVRKFVTEHHKEPLLPFRSFRQHFLILAPACNKVLLHQ